MRFHKIGEAKKEHTQNVDSDFIHNVLFVDNAILPLVLGQDVAKHDQRGENEQQNVPEGHSVHANNYQRINYSSREEHDWVNQSYISRMIQFKSVVDRSVPLWLLHRIFEFYLLTCSLSNVFQLIFLIKIPARFFLALKHCVIRFGVSLRSYISDFVWCAGHIWRQFPSRELWVIRLGRQNNIAVILTTFEKLLLTCCRIEA